MARGVAITEGYYSRGLLLSSGRGSFSVGGQRDSLVTDASPTIVIQTARDDGVSAINNQEAVTSYPDASGGVKSLPTGVWIVREKPLEEPKQWDEQSEAGKPINRRSNPDEHDDEYDRIDDHCEERPRLQLGEVLGRRWFRHPFFPDAHRLPYS